MNPTIQAAIAEAHQANDRLLKALAKVPEDRLDWSPSQTSRNALHLVAHCANSLGFISQMLNGTPYPAATTEQADAEFLAMEKAISTREAALELWAVKHAEHLACLKAIQEDRLDDAVTLPFGLGTAPLRFIANVGSVHTREHLAQLDYLQTIYGDRSW